MFTLKKFIVEHKGRVIYNCKFSEVNADTRENIFTTLIIGENGVGKSFLLSLVADFFRYVGTKYKGRNFKYENTSVTYSMYGCEFEIVKKKEHIFFLKDGNIINFGLLELPTKLLSISFMVNDKFSFSFSHDDSYRYLGVRATSNATYTSSIQNKLFSAFCSSLSDPLKNNALKITLDFLDLKNELQIEYKLLRKTLFTRGITKDVLQKKIYSLKSNREYSSNKINETINCSLEELLTYIERVRPFYNKKSNSIILPITISTDNSYDPAIIQHLKAMEALEFISFPDIKFIKNDIFNFEYTSSGEKNFIYTMVNLISQIDHNALILIDEPEMSLHPRWQMKYIRMLKEITKNYPSAHCILASHSHFMVSDLDPKTSSLVAINNQKKCDTDERVSELIDYDTYAWSAESILYNVFKLRTTRNFYFESDLSRLLTLISEGKEHQEIKRLCKKLSQYVFNEHDPINSILRQADEFIRMADNDSQAT